MFASISLLTLLLITLLGQRSKAAAIYKLTSRAHTSIALSDSKSGGMAHTVAVQVGGTWLDVLVDTGSAQFWVASQGCSTCKNAGMPVAALSAPAQCDMKTIPYSLGRVSGCVVPADVKIGGYDLPNQPVLAAGEIDEHLQTWSKFASGLLGLARATPGSAVGRTPLQYLYDSGQIETLTFGFYLSRDWQTPGEITFGDVTQSAHIDTLRSVKLASAGDFLGQYYVHLGEMKLGAAQISSGGIANVDTGTSHILLPAELVESTYQALVGDQWRRTQAGYYVIPCTRPESTADLTLTFTGQDWSIPYENLIGESAAGYEHLDYCWAKIGAATESDHHQYILGGPFLKSVYSAFDASDGSVTFYGLKA